MDREIKFRAWDGRKIIYPDYDGWFDKCFLKQYKTLQTIQLTAVLRELTAMQYTGLKDKSGKEIYEGDIIWEKSRLDWHSLVSDYYVIEFGGQDLGDHGYQQTIGWNATPIKEFGKPSLMDSGRLGKGILGLCFNHSGIDCEVIGNIYENPELL